MSKPCAGDARSSFAQSFFQSASDDGSLHDDEGAQTSPDGRTPSFPVPRSRPASRRSVARRLTSDSMTNSVAAAAAQAAAEVFGSNEGDTERSSWYEDALRQQGGTEETLKAFLSGVDEQPTDVVDSFGDREVLEQYRIMAQCEARMRVKESIGFDMEEYENTHKLAEEPKDKWAFYGGGTKKAKYRLPEPTRPSPESETLQTEEPPLLPPRPDVKLVQQRANRVAEMCPGYVSRGDDIPAGEHLVRCLGCRCSLLVNQMATLVSCPECHVTSSASSTRR